MFRKLRYALAALLASAVVFAALPAADDFERANSTDLGANWTPNANDSGSLQITSGYVVLNVNSDASELWNADVFPQDQYSEVIFAATGANGVGSGYGPTCREITASQTYYRLIVNGSGYELGKLSTGSFTSVTSGSGTTFAAADEARLECTGSNPTTLKMFKNDVQFGGTQSDSSSPLTTGGAGIGYSSTDNDTRIASWAGGAVSAGGSSVVPKIYQQMMVPANDDEFHVRLVANSRF